MQGQVRLPTETGGQEGNNHVLTISLISALIRFFQALRHLVYILCVVVVEKGCKTVCSTYESADCM